MTVYTAEEVAEILKIKVSSVGKLTRDGKLKKIANVGNIRITKEELDNFIKKGE